MSRNISFGIHEWYHCFNRGVDKRKIFLSNTDYDRFLALLYLANSNEPVHIDDLTKYKESRGRTLLDEAYEVTRGEMLVDVGAYCLMPNHFHLILRERIEGGITAFMRKVSTGYTMYFNKKNDRTGPLLGGKFRARHISDDRYFKRVVNYVHANPAEIIESKWKQGIIQHRKEVRDFLEAYKYSSLSYFVKPNMDTSSITNKELVLDIFETFPSTNDLLEDAITFAKNPEEVIA